MRHCRIAVEIKVEPEGGPITTISMPKTFVNMCNVRRTIRGLARQMRKAAQ